MTKYRTEIEQQCHTRVDQACKPTQTHVPSQECAPRYETRCDTEYHTVKEPAYRQECHEEVHHVCEKHTKVEVPVEVIVEVPVPVKVPYPQYTCTNCAPPPTPPYFFHPTPTSHPHHPTPTHYLHNPTPSPYPHLPSPTPQHPTPSPYPHHPSPTPYSFSPSPSPFPHHNSPSPFPPTAHFASTTPRLHVQPHPATPTPHHSPTPTPLPSLKSPTPHNHHRTTPTPHHHSTSPTPHRQLNVASPRSDSFGLDAAQAALVERFNTQLQHQEEEVAKVVRRKRGVVFPDDSADETRDLGRHQRKAAPQDRLRSPRQRPQILGGTVNLSGPRRPNFSLQSSLSNLPGLVVDRPVIQGVLVDGLRVQGVSLQALSE